MKREARYSSPLGRRPAWFISHSHRGSGLAHAYLRACTNLIWAWPCAQLVAMVAMVPRGRLVTTSNNDKHPARSRSRR